MSLTKVTNSMISGAQINVRDFGAVGDGVTDDSAAIQAAFDYAEVIRLANTSVGVTVCFGNNDSYLVASPVIARNVSIAGNGAKLLSNTNINILTVIGNVHTYTDFHCWYNNQKSDPAAIAIKLTEGTLQASKNTWIGVTTRNAHTGFYNVKTGPAAADASIFGTVFLNCRADYCYDWGWYCDTGGGTTLTLIGCNANGQIPISTSVSKGYYFESFGDLVMSNCSADLLPDGSALVTVNCSSIQIDTFAVESCSLKTANSKMLSFTTATHINIGCVLLKVTTIDIGVGNNAYIVWLATCLANNIGQISSQFQTLTSGTLYKLRSSGTGRTQTSFVPKSDVNTFGVDQNFFDFGRFVGLTSSDPSATFTDAHVAGDIALRQPPVQGIELGWVCTTAGTPGTWQPFGQTGALTSIAATPRFVGQFAVVAGVGYMATGTASTADWKQITP